MASSNESCSSDDQSELVELKVRKLKALLLQHSLKENMLGLLTPQKAFYRWLILTRQDFTRSLLNTMLRNCRISPSKVSWVLFTLGDRQKDDQQARKKLRRLRLGLSQIIGIAQKVLYRNKHHFFFQGRLLVFCLPLVNHLVSVMNGSARSALNRLRLFLKKDKFDRAAGLLTFAERPIRSPVLDAFWHIRLEAATKRKKIVHFNIDSHPRQGYSVDVLYSARPLTTNF